MIVEKTDTTFIHRQSAHCESGATSSLLSHYGLNASEPLVFGIGAGIFFGYFPFIKVYGSPFITYRNRPGRILKSTAKRLGVRFETFKFKDPEKAMDALDSAIDKGYTGRPPGRRLLAPLHAGCHAVSFQCPLTHCLRQRRKRLPHQ